MWNSLDDSHGIAGDQEFLIGRDRVSQKLRIVRRNQPFATGSFLISLLVHSKSGPLHAGTNAGAHIGRILPDAASEHDRVRSTHRSQIRANILSRAVAEDLNRQPHSTIIVL